VGEHGPEELARSLATIVRELLAQGSVEQTLDRITELAVSTVPGTESAGILLLRGGGRVETRAATSDIVRASDQAQLELGEGPCFDALREKETYRTDDIGNESRWPRYGPRARELGIRSMLGYQLFTAEDTLGALNLYSGRSHAFNDRAERIGWIFAANAAVALAAEQYGAQMREALATRQGIGEAVGILMERYRLTEEAAFDALRRASQENNMKLREVARRVTETGQGPADAARR
jgi:GAF domain-containing protein